MKANNGCKNNDIGKKDYPARTFRIPPSLLERLNKYCSTTGVSKTFVVEKALEQYLNGIAPISDEE